MQLLAKLKKMTDWRWKVESKCGEIERNGKLRRLTPQMGSDQCVPRCTSPPETILGSVGPFSDENVLSAPKKYVADPQLLDCQCVEIQFKGYSL